MGQHIYVDDVVDANRTLLESDGADGDVLNIGSSDNISIQELAETVRDKLGATLTDDGLSIAES